MILIIAEKPSLARNIAAGIGKMQRADGFLYDKNYIITWAFGHLFSLADIEDYSPSSEGRWTLQNIPCFPEKFEYKLKRDKNGVVDTGVKKQFETIKTLLSRDDVDTVVNAGDSDREGEIIVRICIDKADCKNKAFKRLWLPDQTPQTVRFALSDMKDESEYDNLANEGYARTFMDWLYGVNLTRYATLKTGTLLRVGRVIVPIVKAIYDRDIAIRNFKPDIYYAITSKAKTKGEEIELTSTKKFEKNDLKKAEELCEKYNAQEATVIDKKTKKDSLKAGKLYSLTKLQNFLGKKYKMPMEESLKILQGLYEKGYVTYPRTNSEYLATAEKDKIKMILDGVKKLGYPVEFKTGKNIFDDSKIEAHSALTPTYKIPQKDALTDDEKKVYGAVMRRFVAVFCSEECEVQKQEIKIAVGDLEEFTLKGTVILKPGWTKFDDYTKKDKILPDLEKGDKVNIDFKPQEKETTPPKHYTIETLNNYLKNPFREDKQNIETEDDAEEYRAVFEGLELGTEATRTGIIDNAIKSGYISLKKDVYSILSGGEFLIESLKRMNISMDKYKTSEFGKALKKVYHGEMPIEESVKLAENEIKRVFEEQTADDGFVGDIVGKCPLCQKEVVRTRFGYSCTGYRDGCKFSVNNVILGKTVSIANMKKLLETGESDKIDGFISKRTGKEFSAKLKLENGKTVFDFN
ncbi:MAG: topoisomerase C-terminal repeat-containing protein [Clostridia bacterium]|nr:topoisomerase C-terminal repeat-containing protein [Clostridia bacterium]MBQ7751626.1 topoisomerase C-terminal repeat-containing protein [Clostridia bacterium]